MPATKLHNAPGYRTAFTLVQLLVVLVIVAVAREHARRIVCLNHDHQTPGLLLACSIENKPPFPHGIRLRGSYNGAGIAFDPHPREVHLSTYQWMTNATGSDRLFMCPSAALYSAHSGNTGPPTFNSTVQHPLVRPLVNAAYPRFL